MAKAAAASAVQAAPALPEIGPAERFSLAHVPAQGPWLLERLAARWPNVSRETLAGKLRQWLGSGDYALVRTPQAVAMAQFWPEELEALPSAWIRFLFVEQGQDASKHAHRLIRALEAWARSKRIGRLWLDPSACDAMPGDVKSHSGLASMTVLVREIKP